MRGVFRRPLNVSPLLRQAQWHKSLAWPTPAWLGKTYLEHKQTIIYRNSLPRKALTAIPWLFLRCIGCLSTESSQAYRSLFTSNLSSSMWFWGRVVVWGPPICTRATLPGNTSERVDIETDQKWISRFEIEETTDDGSDCSSRKMGGMFPIKPTPNLYRQNHSNNLFSNPVG